MVSSKGKDKVGDKGSAGKRKIDLDGGTDDDKTGKRKKSSVLQFFEDSAFEVGDDEYSDDSDFFDADFIEDDFVTDAGVQNEQVKAPVFPLVPKEEEMDEEELEKMLRERYKAGSSFVTFPEEGFERKGPIEVDMTVPSTKDPTIWKVKCMVGRERHSAFCLMQKYVDLGDLGMKLQIISAFSLDHVKGFVYIEADKQFDVNEACKGLCSIYSSRMTPVPRNEVSQLISVRSKCNGISEGMWARVKNGKYKGDLAQVVAVNDLQKKVTVKLIPRIDLQALAEKFGGGVVTKKASVPTPRLIRSTELDDFRPLITFRKDRETNQMVEVLDGKMLKDGFLFKKTSIDSLSFWGVMPSETELLKFEPCKNDEPQDTEWLSQLYGERKRKRTIKHDKGNGKGGEKGEGSSNSTNGNSFEVDDLVFFGRKDFGIIIGTEKENYYKIMKESAEGQALVTIQLRDLRAACFDKKFFTVKDQHKKTVSINDIVRVLDGPSKDRQGIVKQIYKGVIFLYDEASEEHNRYVCVKAQMCEKISRSHGLLSGKESEAGPSSAFAEIPSSPTTPLSPKKPCRERGDSINFSREDKNMLFSIGQSVRIRVGPLKGYICRVLAVRQSDVTVKLDSRQKILTVKSEHLSEVQGKSSTTSFGAEPETTKPFDLLGVQDGSGDWTAGGVPPAAQDDGWNAGLSSSERSSWPSFPTSSLPTQLDPNSASPLDAVNATNNGAGSSAWESGTTQSKNVSWGASGVVEKNVADAGQDSGWGGSDSWKRSAPTTAVGSSSDSWGKKKVEESAGGENDGPSWGKSVGSQVKDTTVGNSDSWGSKGVASSSLAGPVSESGGWGNAGTSQDGGSSWNKKEDKSSWAKQGGESSWGQESKTRDSSGGGENGGSSWGKQDGGSWNKQDGGSWSKKEDKSSWNKQGGGISLGQQADKDGASWNKQDGGSSWSKQDGGSWNKEDKSTWNKQDGGLSSGQQVDKDGASWNKQEGGASWSKQDGGSSWNKQDGGSSWNKQDGGSSWNKQDGGSSWNGGDFGNKDGSDQQGSWSRGRGSGGRRGRGGGRERDNFGRGRGRSFERGDSSSWGKEGEDNYGSGFAGGQSSWKSSQESSWGKATSFDGSKKNDWGNQNASERDEGSGKNQGWGVVKEAGESGDKWLSNKAGSSSGWRSDQFEKPEGDKDSAFNKSSDWKSEGSWNAVKPSGESQSSGWNRNPSANEEKNKSGDDGWSTGKGTGSDKQSSGWGGSEQQSWNTSKPPESGWQIESTEPSSWNRKPSVNEEKNTSGYDGWGAGKGTGSETKQSSGWGGSEQSRNTSKSSASGWKSESTQDPNAWSSKSDWNSGGGFSGNDQQPDSSYERGRGGGWRGGRGGSDRGGGFRGRRGSDRGSFQGGRGSFRGRGSFDNRGGFGGRGRGRRDQNDEGNNINDFGDGKPSSWHNGSSSDAGGGWKASENKGSWSEGGSGKGNWQSWSSGGSTPKADGHSSEAGEWKNKNDFGGGKPSSWNNVSSSDTGSWKASDNKGSWNNGGSEKGQWQTGAGGWKKGSSSDAGGGDASASKWATKENTSGNVSSSWNSSRASEVTDNKGSWNQGGSEKGQWQTNSAGGTDAGGWNKGSSSNTGDGASKWTTQENTQGNANSSWNSTRSNASEPEKPKEASEVTESGGPADAWGKASSSWGKGSDGAKW